MAQYNVNNIMVSSLLSSIRDGIIAIPEIQRPFVWDPTKVRDLIDSLYKGYPVGYIIIWQNPDVKLKDGTISSGKKIIIEAFEKDFVEKYYSNDRSAGFRFYVSNKVLFSIDMSVNENYPFPLITMLYLDE